MFLMVMEIRDEEGYRLALRWMPVFIICTIIGYASCIFILPNVYKSFARKESLAARILLSLFLVLSFPIYVKNSYWVADMTLMLYEEIRLYELKQPITNLME